jgi:hypothetical protein
MKSLKLCALAVAALVVAAPARAAETETLVRAARCEALLLSQVKTYSVLSTLLTGTQPVALDAGTRKTFTILAESFDRFGDATLKRAQVLDTYAATLAPGKDGIAIYKKVVDVQARGFLATTIRATTGVLPSPETLDEMSKEKMACDDWIDNEIVPLLNQ